MSNTGDMKFIRINNLESMAHSWVEDNITKPIKETVIEPIEELGQDVLDLGEEVLEGAWDVVGYPVNLAAGALVTGSLSDGFEFANDQLLDSVGDVMTTGEEAFDSFVDAIPALIIAGTAVIGGAGLVGVGPAAGILSGGAGALGVTVPGGFTVAAAPGAISTGLAGITAAGSTVAAGVGSLIAAAPGALAAGASSLAAGATALGGWAAGGLAAGAATLGGWAATGGAALAGAAGTAGAFIGANALPLGLGVAAGGLAANALADDGAQGQQAAAQPQPEELLPVIVNSQNGPVLVQPIGVGPNPGEVIIETETGPVTLATGEPVVATLENGTQIVVRPTAEPGAQPAPTASGNIWDNIHDEVVRPVQDSVTPQPEGSVTVTPDGTTTITESANGVTVVQVDADRDGNNESVLVTNANGEVVLAINDLNDDSVPETLIVDGVDMSPEAAAPEPVQEPHWADGIDIPIDSTPYMPTIPTPEEYVDIARDNLSFHEDALSAFEEERMDENGEVDISPEDRGEYNQLIGNVADAQNYLADQLDNVGKHDEAAGHRQVATDLQQGIMHVSYVEIENQLTAQGQAQQDVDDAQARVDDANAEIDSLPADDVRDAHEDELRAANEELAEAEARLEEIEGMTYGDSPAMSAIDVTAAGGEVVPGFTGPVGIMPDGSIVAIDVPESSGIPDWEAIAQSPGIAVLNGSPFEIDLADPQSVMTADGIFADAMSGPGPDESPFVELEVAVGPAPTTFEPA